MEKQGAQFAIYVVSSLFRGFHWNQRSASPFL